MSIFHDAFISYGRADSKAFVMQLNDRLTAAGLNIWFDFEDIPIGVDYQNQIDDGIEKADNFLFIISPHSINSPYCRKEIELAVRCNKRIVPLMHVEQINRDTWQQRNPTGTDAQWEIYQSKGLHSSYPNMHPDISRINWIYTREGIDDPDHALTQLLQLFDRHRTYVHQHTILLSQALDWQRHNQQSQYLLTGEEHRQAQTWLQVHFQNEQPPCLPTDLHCEFITESIKNADNLMTQVFLAHAEEDDTVSDRVRRNLMREGFTVWVSKTDIQTGAEFQTAIDRGIEEADNIVYLLSPDAIQSPYCQHELNYALSLNKRIIPILVRPTDPALVPLALRNLQYIDLTNNSTESDYQHDESRLIRILREDATYYKEHKLLLAKALKWERQQRNPSLLLRGYNLNYAETWLSAAKARSQYRPVPVHEDFITASLQQPPEPSLDVFISYSRADSDFARQLNDALQLQGKTTWFDQESIASGADFQQEIYRGIETSNNILFVISPNSIHSPYCAGEVEYAVSLKKRIVTVLYRSVPASDLPPALAKVQWIDFNQHDRDFYANFGELIRTLDTDPEHRKAHTRLLTRALEWQRADHDPSFLLRGTDLAAAEQWLQQATNKIPAPTDLQTQYITTSRQAPLRQAALRTVLQTSLAATLLLSGLRLLGLLQPLELKAFDHLMQVRPPESPDSRLLIIEVTEADITKKLARREKGQGTLSDESLDRLLQKLEPYQPRVIGLDLFRDFAVDPGVPGLADRLRQTDRLLGICKLPEIVNGTQSAPGLAPPKEIPIQRIGFADVISDHDEVLRRHQLRVVPPENAACQATQAIGFLLARRYLELEPGKTLTYIDPVQSDGILQLGSAVFPPRLNFLAGGYQGIDSSGYQLLINYRTPAGDPLNIAERVSLGEILEDRVRPEQIAAWRDRLILIGITSNFSAQDVVRTPYKEVHGVILQAQIASQILSTVLNRRLSLRVLPFWGDWLWILGWSCMGGLIVYKLRSPTRLLWASGAAIVGLYLSCWVGLSFAGLWLPLVPATLSLLSTASSVLFFTARPAKRLNARSPKVL